ncbi:MAG TPA: amidase [Xanthobacteraceae bacterium]|jgi:Asp-tRNA(Asn)/Glu-tRNA(Gln) amidotransferase A subunit family amidase|nr:amidase [Xanthobacteraceae bacterium]
MSVVESAAKTFAPRPFLAASKQFAAGADTPRGYLERCLAALSEHEPAVGAFVTTDTDGARKSADAATARWRAGKPRSAIDGMPVGIKDIMETYDMPTQMGSPLFEGWRSGRDAAAVYALRAAGAVIVGKAVTTEFAATHPRGTRNPHDPRRTPGGSSSGSAAAVATGMVAAALGTQVVGSILRPSGFCGVVGFKPTVGAINRGGSHDYLSQSCTGPIAATLEDAWVVAREIARRVGGDPGFPRLAGPMTPPPAKTPRALAVLETAGWPVATAGARQELERAVARLRSAGVAILTRRDTPLVETIERALHEAMPLTRAINEWEWVWPLNDYSRRDSSALSESMRERLKLAEAMQEGQYEELIAERARVRTHYAELAAIADGAVTLSAPGAAPVDLGWTGDPIFVVSGSLLGVPTVSLPLLEDEGLPLGLQVLGFAQRDADLIATAAAIRDAVGSK